MPPPARLLSLTRLVSRAGRTLTGVDRVELAYAEHLAGGKVPAWGLVRTALGWVLLDRDGVAAVVRASRDGAWEEADLLSRLSRRLTPEQRRGQAFARARAVGRAPPWGLGRLLRRLPRGTASLFVGHADLDDRALGAAKALGPVTALVHDTIPLDLPQFQRPGTPDRFARKLAAVGRHASLVVTPSEVAARDVRRRLAALGPVPEVTGAHLGVPVPVPGALPPGLPPPGPYVVALGTIEPRKNHAFLLDVWEGWEGAPTLVIAGGRGWANEEVFRRLDARLPRMVEAPGLPDGAVAALLAGARALVMPSFAEGFGLPAVEAAALGCRVICGPLAIFRETLGAAAIVRPLGDIYAWRGAVAEAVEAKGPAPRLAPPTWAAHFKAVLSRV